MVQSASRSALLCYELMQDACFKMLNTIIYLIHGSFSHSHNKYFDMNTRLTHACGWIRPDQTLIQCDTPVRLYTCLFQHHPLLQQQLQTTTPELWLLDLYTQGWTCVSRRRDTCVFEHGVNHTPSPVTHQQLVSHHTWHGSPVICRNRLYQVQMHHAPERRRLFGTPTLS